MKKLKISLLQILPDNTVQNNLEKGIKYCIKAKNKGADIVLFPEMWSTGYTILEDIEKLKNSAIDYEDIFLKIYKDLAEALDLAIGVTFLEKYEPLPRNTFVLFDRHGKKVLSYSKVHTCDFGDEARITPGDDFQVCDLDTKKGKVKVGAMICYDREFPESARILMLKGAELILVPNACPMDMNRIAQLRTRAFENMVAIATANYPKGKDDCNGTSTIFDGVAYLPDSTVARNFCILETGDKEDIYSGDIDLDLLRNYRKEEVHGNAYRRPEKYSKLIDETIEEPFIRRDRKK